MERGERMGGEKRGDSVRSQDMIVRKHRERLTPFKRGRGRGIQKKKGGRPLFTVVV
jgi:hypothetical protein